MHKKLILYIVILFISNITISQTINDSISILIYSEGDMFLQPFIETTIKDLTNKESNKKYFFKVNSFNRFVSDNKYQAELSDLIRTITPENRTLNSKYTIHEKIIRKRIFNILMEYEYFLSVKTNTLGELIEFQFQLYKTVNTNNSVSFNVTDKVIGVENFFVNPKSNDYLEKIKNGIERLFLHSNKSPEARLKIYNKYINDGDIVKLPLNEKILFDGSNSGDYDSEFITYEWRNIPDSKKTFQTFEKLKFLDGKDKQSILINNPGSYNIGFKVYDGVSYSEEILFKILTIDRPKKIQLLDSIVRTIHIQSVLNYNSSLTQKGTAFLNNNKNEYQDFNTVFTRQEKINERFINPNEINFAFLKKYNENGIFQIEIESKFPFSEINNKNQIYLYSLGEENVVSKPTIITHNLIRQSLLNLHLDSGPISLMSKGQPLKTKEGVALYQNHSEANSGELFLSIDIGMGLLISKNLEIGASYGILNSNKAYYKDFIINLSSNFKSWLSYTIITGGKFDPFVSTIMRNYKFKQNEGENMNTISLEGLIGAKYHLYNSNKTSMELKVSYSYGTFLENKLSDLYTVTFGIGTILKFNY
ncbi:hypothetical protein LX95_00947 [Mesonia algae]|uniref:Uncharacterized protein n=1 Tax=Mesonia algae TaxID=213248 RepID=A0A2W7I6U1_9FLAO|nr:hypothetical protein [Mesonia algae]PZW42631.1 hypothetical protein LX95_00947 [Mesonia algae]